MLSKKLEKDLNTQINAELWSSYLYYSMAVHFAAEGHAGFAHWFNLQASEELDHMMILTNYIISRGGRVKLNPVKEVKTSWKSPLEAMEDTLSHEREVTGMIHALFAEAMDTKDFATTSALQWFVDEQVEEEEVAKGLVDKLKIIQNDGAGIYVLDNELATRVYTQATPLAGKLIR